MDHPYRWHGHPLDVIWKTETTSVSGITRAHLEEDAGKSLSRRLSRHDRGVDLKSLQTPIALKFVSEPGHSISFKRKAVAYVKMITLLLWLILVFVMATMAVRLNALRCQYHHLGPKRTNWVTAHALKSKNVNSIHVFIEKANLHN